MGRTTTTLNGDDQFPEHFHSNRDEYLICYEWLHFLKIHLIQLRLLHIAIS
jgi:hypothetical protein